MIFLDSSNTEENDLTTVNNTIFEDKRRKPKQILDEQILDSLENDTTTLFPTVSPKKIRFKIQISLWTNEEDPVNKKIKKNVDF